jgi:SAM-dependent methyltransferase
LKSVSVCPVCGSSKFRKVSRGFVAPFLAHRIWGRGTFRIALVRCGTCDFVFFNPRLEPSEEAKLYSGYRNPEYLRERRAIEPWYTERLNAGFMDPAFLERRKAALLERLQGHLASDEACRILDFGGSHGQLAKDLLPNSSAYVYDISGVQPLDGVTRCADLAECQHYRFDVVICSHVLEHVGSPRAIIEQIHRIAAPNTLVWIEVPQESPFDWNLILRRLVQEAILLALRPRIALRLLRPGMSHWMHEHVNSFNPESLRALLRSGGFDVLACDTYNLRSRLEKMVWVVGKAAACSSSDAAPSHEIAAPSHLSQFQTAKPESSSFE